jgi:hypothetical protein
MIRQIERMEAWLTAKPRRGDATALLILTGLWAFFFWRAVAGEVSLPEGDFSGQFLAFGAYQARRLLAGEIPLWNPYNFAGHPFIADTQAAVFYPPRLVTIALSSLFGGWRYAALEAEVLAHFWMASVWMYLFARTVAGSRLAGMVSALTLTYGGYLTGYPPLQCAVLEAGIWLPLALLGIHRQRWELAATALGLSLLAGHPQTSLFLIYVVVAYSIHRAIVAHWKPLPTLFGMGMVLAIGAGLAAVQLLPGLEYLRLTTRAAMTYEDMAGGFPLSDLVTFFVPNVVTVWSPLYSGIAALALAVWAVWRGERSARFWGIVALAALGISFGGATVLYRLAYLFGPGFAWFRGQERAAYVIAYSIAILAGLGTASLLRNGAADRLARTLRWATIVAWAFALEVFLADRLFPEADIFPLLKGAVFASVLISLTWAVVRLRPRAPAVVWGAAAVALVAFDLFSNTIGTNWEAIPPGEHHLLAPETAVVEEDERLFRVDGLVGFGENDGTMIGVQDIRGISPLRLATLDNYFDLPQYRLHQVLAVRYVFTDWRELEVPSTIRAEGELGPWPVYVHEIDDPMPRSWLAFRTVTTTDEGRALEWLADPNFDIGGTVILAQEPPLALPETPPADWRAEVVTYAPEHIIIETDSSTDAILVVSEMAYPGWRAWVDGEPAAIWRADAGLRAIPLEAGEHRIEMAYRPLTVVIGAVISGAAIVALGILLAREARR